MRYLRPYSERRGSMVAYPSDLSLGDLYAFAKTSLSRY